MTENWKPVPRYEETYEVSDLGSVRSLDRIQGTYGGRSWLRKGRAMKLTTVLDKGYQVITLSSYGLQTRRYVHDLVLEAFTGPRPDGMEGCHNDGVPANNVHSNLRWDTHQGNNADKKLHGTAQIGTLHWKCVYTADQIRECKRLSATGLDATEVSRITGVKVSTVAQVKAGRHWAHI